MQKLVASLYNSAFTSSFSKDFFRRRREDQIISYEICADYSAVSSILAV